MHSQTWKPKRGRPRKLPSLKRIMAMLDRGWNKVEIGREYGVTGSAVGKALKRGKNGLDRKATDRINQY